MDARGFLRGARNTRRGFVRGVLAGGAATLVFSGRSAEAAAPNPLDGAVGDPAILARLAQIEQLVVFSYRHLIGAVSLSAVGGSTLRRFLAQERVHLQVLSTQLSRHSASLPAAPTSVGAADRALVRLGVPGSLERVRLEGQALGLLIDIETVEEEAFHAAVGKLSDLGLVKLAAQSGTCDSQHWTVLSALRHGGDATQAVPHAFAPLATELG